MLVNPVFLWQNAGKVLALTFLIVVGKAVITFLLGLILPRPARTFLVVAVGLSQVGEFSFILGQAGVSLGLLDQNQYALILAGALISITLNPLMYRLLPGIESALKRFPALWQRLNKQGPLPPPPEEPLSEHVVIVGYGRVGGHLVDVLDTLNIPYLVIEDDLERAKALEKRRAVVLYGNAANSEVIVHAGLERARALVVTLPEEDTGALVVAAAREINPGLPIIARAATEEGVAYLSKLGALHVIHPELEGGLEMVHHTLLQLGFPLREVHEYSETVRKDHYSFAIDSDAEHRSLHDMLRAFEGIEIIWLTLIETSPIAGMSLADANLRARSGGSVVALIRDGKLIPNPKSASVLLAGDRLGVIGEGEQIEAVKKLVQGEEELGQILPSQSAVHQDPAFE
jgi:CPA2 family monovalent cation:H+ antiporter-2